MLVGTDLISDSVVHDLEFPDRRLTFVTKSGVGTRAAIVLQSGGTVGPSQATLSYLQCPPGQASMDGGCVDCIPGTFTETFDAPVCKACEYGTYSGEAASRCESCEVGRSGLGIAPCTECPIGTAQSASGQPACPAVSHVFAYLELSWCRGASGDCFIVCMLCLVSGWKVLKSNRCSRLH